MSSPTAQQHNEVLGALSALATETGISPERGDLVQADRRSEFEYFGLRTPDRRRRVAAGFSFTDEDAASVLAAWDDIWNLADNGDVMFAALAEWSRSDNEWHRRVAMVSLIHYSGKNAVFMPIEPSLRVLANCAGDRRETVSNALGWVLRELLTVHPDAVLAFFETHAASMPRPAIRRATERLPQPERDRVRASLA